MPQAVDVDLRNSGLEEGHLPKMCNPQGICLEDAAVAVENGVCRVLDINTTTEAVEYEVSPQEIFPHDVYDFSGT